MIDLKIKKSINNKNNLIVLCSDKTNLSKILSKDEIKYVNQKIKQKKTSVTINKLSNFINIQIVKKHRFDYKTLENIRLQANNYYSYLSENKIDKISVVDLFNNKDYALAFTEGLLLSDYRFIKYFSKNNEKKSSLKEISVYSKKITNNDINELVNITKSVYKSRDLVNEPSSYLTAQKLAEEITEIGKQTGLKVEVFGKRKIEALKMGGLLAVNKGSVDPPTFTIIEWKPKNAKNKKPYVLVGKGIVFDTGGLSLKPTAGSMDLMKSDMGGASAVIGAMEAIALQKLPVYIIALIPSTDNRPGGNAYAPQDVITMHNGMTVEVLNTDAEGRMILADALSFAQQYKPELVIDLATLTGAAHAAIGHWGIVGMGNAPKKVFSKLQKSSDNVYERIVEFPFWEEYDELLKSDVADLKNIGGRLAGAITAGKFLEHFTDYPYIHLDIAGPAFMEAKDSYRGKGGSGVGVRLLYDFFKNI